MATDNAAAGAEAQTRTELDLAFQSLPGRATDEELPFLVLDEVHLARWRGHRMARLGAEEAVEGLTSALAQLDPRFARAAASHRCDLALAHSVRGDHAAAGTEALKAQELADRTASERQHRRIRRLLRSGIQSDGVA